MSYPLYGNVIVDSSNGAALGGTLTISNSCKTSVLDNRASIAFAIADISYGALNKGFFSNNVDSADARITAMIDKVSPTVGTAMTFKVSSDHASEPIEALRIASSGNVGIGTPTPAYPLDVTGNIRLGIGTTGNIRFGTTEAGYVDLINNNMTIMNQRSGSLILGTNNGEDMRIASNGRVGIGTQTPAYPLDVTGNIRLGIGTTGNIRFGTTEAGYVDLINNNMTIMNQRSGSLILGTNNGEDMRIASNGRVGIGTQTPLYPLDVNGNIRLGIGTTGNIRFGTTEAGYVDLINNNMTIMNQRSGSLILGTNNGEDMRILTSGNVGIGLTNPDYRLHVAGIIGTNNSVINKKLVLYDNNAADTPTSATNFFGFGINNGMLRYQVDSTDSTHGFFGGSTELLRISYTSGTTRVGIGTTTPNYPLDVTGNIRVGNGKGGVIRFGPSGGFGGTQAAFIELANTNIMNIMNQENGSLILGTNNSQVMYLTNQGRVGIGLPSPTVQLDLSTDGARKLTTTAWTTGSDIRIKENITDADLDICYSICKNLRLKRFTWKDYIGYEDDRNVVGYIAQEVQEVFPKSVSTSKTVLKKKGENGEIIEEEIQDFLSLNVDQINKTLHGAVQKLIQITEQQQTIISNLEARLSMLENK